MAKYDKEYKEKRNQANLEKNILNKKDDISTKVIKESDKSKLLEKIKKPTNNNKNLIEALKSKTVSQVVESTPPDKLKKVGEAITKTSEKLKKLDYQPLSITPVEKDSPSLIKDIIKPKELTTKPLDVSEGFKAKDAGPSKLTKGLAKLQAKQVQVADKLDDVYTAIKPLLNSTAVKKTIDIGKNVGKGVISAAAAPSTAISLALDPSQTGSPEEVAYESNPQQFIQNLEQQKTNEAQTNQLLTPSSPNIPMADTTQEAFPSMPQSPMARTEQTPSISFKPDQAADSAPPVNNDVQPDASTQPDVFTDIAPAPTLEPAIPQYSKYYSKLDSDLEQTLKATEDEYNKKTTDMRSKLQKVDPNNFWNSKSTGEKLGLALALAMSTYGSALAGTENHGLKMIMNAVDQDIESQKENNKLTLEELNVVKDEYLSKVQNQIAVSANKLNSEQARQNAFKINADIQMKRDELAMESEKIKVTQMVEAQKNRVAQYAANKIQNGEGFEQADLAAISVHNPDLYKDIQTIALVDGKNYGTFSKPSETTMNKLRNETIPTANDSLSMINQLQTLGKDPKVKVPGSESHAVAKSLSSMLKGLSRLEIVGPGAVTEAEWKLLESVVANPGELTSLNIQAKLETIKQKVINSAQNKIRAAGFKLPETEQEKSFKKFSKDAESKYGRESQAYYDSVNGYLLENPTTRTGF